MGKQLLTFIFVLGFLASLFGQNKSEGSGKFSGYMFGDYYHVTKNHNPDIKDQHGFWFRRIYFTYDYSIDESWSTRLRFEMAQTGDFVSKNAINPVVKDAWLRYKFSGQSVYIGISSTPTYEIIENTWGYRSVEKTPLDLYKISSSKDFGIALKGKLDKDGIMNYHIMYGNGSSNKDENEKGKSGMLSLSADFKNGLVIEAYGDYTTQTGKNDVYILQGFVFYKKDIFKFGMQYSNVTSRIPDGEDQLFRLASVFVVCNLSDNLSLLGRVDKTFDVNSKVDEIDYIPLDPTSEFVLAILGLDWHPIKNVKVIPNFEFITYSRNNLGLIPQDDLFSRITFFWSFN